MSPDIAALRRRPLQLFLGRLRAALLLTFWLPLLLILIERGLPLLQLGGYLLVVGAVTLVYHAFEAMRDRGRTALVPTAFRLAADSLTLDVRNIGNAPARTCDLQAWVVVVAGDSPAATFESSARRLPLGQGPHFSQRLVAISPGEELRGVTLPRTPGAPTLRPGPCHVKWRTATIDRHDRRTSLEGWVSVMLPSGE